MTKPQIKEHNSETDEIIIREMTDEEYANHQALIQSAQPLNLDTETTQE